MTLSQKRHPLIARLPYYPAYALVVLGCDPATADSAIDRGSKPAYPLHRIHETCHSLLDRLGTFCTRTLTV